MPSTIVSFFSPSPWASRRAQFLLASICKLEKVHLKPFKHDEDKLNSAFQSAVPLFSNTWDSVALKCNSSETILHFLSDAGAKSDHKQRAFALLGITNTTLEESNNQEAVQAFRDLLASNIKHRSSSIKIKCRLGSLGANEMLRDMSTGFLPLLSVAVTEKEGTDIDDSNDDKPSGLKEVVVPFFDFAEYTDGSTILSRLSQAQKPAVGVYQSSVGTRVRPLPTASEDRTLPPPSLVFHCDNLGEVDPKEVGARTGKIGFGVNRTGQIMVQHQDLLGLDIRFCSSEKVTPAFHEAQESLLAASLDELQSKNTLLSGDEKPKDDERIGVGDCWVELRANLKSPSGFLKRLPNRSSGSEGITASPVNTPDS